MAAKLQATGAEVVGCSVAIVTDPATVVDIAVLVEAIVLELVSLVLADEYG